MPTSADVLLDTSAAIALVQPSHVRHEVVLDRVRGHRLGLSGHAAVETYSVLTCLPGGMRVSAAVAARIIRANFPETCALSASTAEEVPTVLAEAGIAGGSSYDGLVGFAAREAGIRMLTCDLRAASTYAKLDVDVDIV